MKKNLLMLAAALFSATALFGQLTVTSPMNHTGADQFTFGGNFQLGASIPYVGFLEDGAGSADSVLCKFYYGNGAWEPDSLEYRIVENVTIEADGSFSTVIDIPADWRTQNFGDTTLIVGEDTITITDNLIRPMMQVQAWSGGEVLAFQLRTGATYASWGDSVSMTMYADGDNFGEVAAGSTVSLGETYYGIDDLRFLEVRLAKYNAAWSTVFDEDFVNVVDADAGDPVAGFMPVTPLAVPADFETTTAQDLIDGNHYKIRVSSLSNAANWSNFIFLNCYVVPAVADSIGVPNALTEYELNDAGDATQTGADIDFGAVAYPNEGDATATQMFLYELSDSSVASIDSLTGVVTPSAALAEGATATVDVIVTHRTSGQMITTTVTFTNGFSSVEETLASNVKVFPNPATSELNITGVESANIAIFNLLGAEVMNTQLKGSAVNVSELPAGTYILNIKSNDETIVRKISIQ